MAIVPRPRKGGMSYQVKVRDKWGDYYRGGTFHDEDEARRVEAALEKLQREGVRANIEHDTVDGSPVTALSSFAELRAAWAKECRAGVSEGWRISQDQMLRDYVVTHLDSKSLADIGPRDISNVLDLVRKMGRSEGTVNHVYVLLHDIFTDAIEHFGCKLERNPVLKRYKPKTKKKKVPFLRPQEAIVLLEHVRDHYIGPAIWVGVLAGLRPCEIQALRWEAIDWDLDQILIKSAFKRKVKRLEDFPKQGDWSVSMLPEALKQYLWPRRGDPQAFVCRSPRKPMLSYTTFRKTLRALCKEVKVTEITPHGLRHSASEMWVEEGASSTDVQRVLNHKSASTTAVYMHRTDDRLKRTSPNVGKPLLKLILGTENPVPKSKTA
jgi:integrase